MFFMQLCMAASAGVSQVIDSAIFVLNLQANFFLHLWRDVKRYAAAEELNQDTWLEFQRYKRFSYIQQLDNNS